MGLHEVQERIRKRKKKRRRRMITLLFIIVMISLGIFVTNAPYFKINEIFIEGNEKIPAPLIEEEGKRLLGQNILLLDKKEFEESIAIQPYLLDLKVSRKFPSKIVIKITEKKAEVNYDKDGVISLLTREGTLLETGANKVEGVTLKDETELPRLGENLYKDSPEKIKVLEEFRYLQERNISAVIFSELDLSDMKNIRTYYNDLEIRLGYPDSLKDKLNGAINIISEGNLENVRGYVDISYVDEPVVFDETKLEAPLEDEESTENGDG